MVKEGRGQRRQNRGEGDILGSEVSSGLRFIPVGRHHDGERQRDIAPEPSCGNVP